MWSFGASWKVPVWFEFAAWLLIFLGVLLGLRKSGISGRGVTLAATFCLIVYGGFVRMPELYADVPPAFVQSRRAELLSTVAFGLPVYSIVGLFALFVCAAGLFELVPQGTLPARFGPRAWTWVRVGLGGLFFAFGLLAVFGYGSGSPSPFSP